MSPQESAGFVVRYRFRKGPWDEYTPSKDEILLGRLPECDLRLTDSKIVSRRHARLTFTPDGPLLTDLDSHNGTEIAGEPIPPNRPVALALEQDFTLGDYTLQVLRRKAVAMPAAPQPALKAPPKTIGQEEETWLGESDEERPISIRRPLDLSKTNRIAIGRAADNDLVLRHPRVSRYHAEIERIGQRIQIRDLRSTHGVFVNGARIEQPVWLNDRDSIQIGPYVFSLAGPNLRAHADEGLLLEAKNINQYVSKRLNLLKNISLTIKPMEFVAVVGMSGSGKTTLLNVLSGYRPASDGQVLVNGVDLYKHYDLFRNDMGYVPQKDIVHTELTPFTALEYVAKLRMPPDTTPEERTQAILDVLEDLDLTERKDVPISRLSGGQLKRVSIGVELLTKPRLFFLDEPTSGLDPGTEYDMMRLLRRLADQGRTVMLVTHATKNVMLCDKVIFLARGGYLTFFGAPDEALAYFDQYRTTRERRQKDMEFDDIYRILNDEKRGSPADWAARFMVWQHPQADRAQAMGAAPREVSKPRRSPQELTVQGGANKRVSALRQFIILSARNLKILRQDKVSLALMLALAPGIGLLDFMWGRDLFDPVKGDASKILTMWFLSALTTVLVGALSSVREIVKEAPIYQRERAVNLKILPYVLSKVWVGVVLALYQALVLLFTRVVFNNPKMPNNAAYVALYITIFLSTLCGYLIGLVVSASAPNQNAANLMIIAVLVPQFMFAGALLPLDLIPGGEKISVFMPTRWVFEALVNVSGMGDPLIKDPCWQKPEKERKAMLEKDKENCTCFGPNIFTKCNTFPGILSPDFYDAKAQQVLSQPAPIEPPQPTAFPYPTAYPSPTPLPTPTLRPSPTPPPTPTDLRKIQDYMDQQKADGKKYQDSILEQFSEYRKDSERQGQLYSDQRTRQGDEYAALRQKQGDEYKKQMQAYGDARSAYEEARQKAISGAESMLEIMYDNFGRAFRGKVTERWGALAAIMAGLTGLLVFFQKRKDVI